ncbi:hypothetical protein Dimus_030569 [Dionaea muscipula]
MSSPSREWSWEPHVPIHPSLLEMNPLRIPSPAPDSPEYSCRGFEESSFSGDESCPPCELDEGDALCVSARLEDRSPKKLRIKLKLRSLGESSQSRPETTTLCVVDAADTLGPLPGRGEVALSEPSNDESLLKSFRRPAGCKALLRIVSRSPDLSCPELELSSSSFLSTGGGGSNRFHGLDGMTKGQRLQLPSRAFANRGRGRRGAGGRGHPDSPDRARVITCDPEDRDWRSSRDAEDRPPKPPSVELTRGKGVASDYPRESQKRRLPTGPIDFQDPFGGRESAVPLGGSACGSSSSVTPASYAKERFKYEMIDGHRVELDFSGNILPRDLHCAGPQPKICGLPHPNDGFICCESNALAPVQAMANVSLADQKVYHHKTKGRMAEWMGRDLNWNLVQV